MTCHGKISVCWVLDQRVGYSAWGWKLKHMWAVLRTDTWQRPHPLGEVSNSNSVVVETFASDNWFFIPVNPNHQYNGWQHELRSWNKATNQLLRFEDMGRVQTEHRFLIQAVWWNSFRYKLLKISKPKIRGWAETKPKVWSRSRNFGFWIKLSVSVGFGFCRTTENNGITVKTAKKKAERFLFLHLF